MLTFVSPTLLAKSSVDSTVEARRSLARDRTHPACGGNNQLRTADLAAAPTVTPNVPICDPVVQLPIFHNTKLRQRKCKSSLHAYPDSLHGRQGNGNLAERGVDAQKITHKENHSCIPVHATLRLSVRRKVSRWSTCVSALIAISPTSPQQRRHLHLLITASLPPFALHCPACGPPLS